MPTADYAVTMARYNLWQNDNLVSAASALSAEARELERGAFFGSIQKTFFHLFWADRAWMSRFTGTTPPEGGIPQSVVFDGSWEEFRDRRTELDNRILHWAKSVDPDWFAGDLTWFSGALGRQMTKPKGILLIQLFNHQTHHRGQIHAMLTAAGARPGATDVSFMPEAFQEP
ncbi:DinB family protein [Pseudochelatococcus sp. B33]